MLMFIAFASALYVNVMLVPLLDRHNDEEPPPPMTSRQKGSKKGASSKKRPATGLKMLAPCVPNSRLTGTTGRAFRENLLACGTLLHLEGFNETVIYAYELSTLDQLSPRQALKCKLALLYHVSVNPLPLWYPLPSVAEVKERIPLPGVWELGL